MSSHSLRSDRAVWIGLLLREGDQTVVIVNVIRECYAMNIYVSQAHGM